eukprot:1158181-Pelagomonas_calceolata.AAC.2
MDAALRNQISLTFALSACKRGEQCLHEVPTNWFPPNRHVAQMLRNSSLEQLLGEHRSTAKDIKNLESDIQQLVYENYSKFISATDTIRAMKTRVDGAMPELHHLKSTMGG